MRNSRARRALIMMDFANALAAESKCEERKVAAVITDNKMTQVLSIGVNGGPKGLVDCLCAVDGKYGCIHAEINALNKNTSPVPGKIMFVTLAPCKQCAAAIINDDGGFSTVYYREAWKEDTGLRLLKSAGISVYQI